MLHLGKSLEDFKYEATEMGFKEIEIEIFIQEESVRQHFEKEMSMLIEKRNTLLDEKRTVFTEIHKKLMTRMDTFRRKIREEKLSLEEILLLKEEIQKEEIHSEEQTRLGEQKEQKILMTLKSIKLEIDEKERKLEFELAKISKDVTTKWLVNKDKKNLLTVNNETKEEMLTLANNDDQTGSNVIKKGRHATELASEKATPLLKTKALDVTQTKTDNTNSRLPAARGDDGRAEAVDIKDKRLRQATASVKMSMTEGGQGEVTVTDGANWRLCEKGKQSAQQLMGATVTVNVTQEREVTTVSDASPKVITCKDHVRDIWKSDMTIDESSWSNVGKEFSISKQECLVVKDKCLGIDEMVRNEFIPESHENVDFLDNCISLKQTKTDVGMTSRKRQIQQLRDVNIKYERVSKFNLSYNFVPPAVLIKLQVRRTVATKDHGLTGKPYVRNLWPVNCKSMLTWKTFLLETISHFKVHNIFSPSIDMPRTGIGTFCLRAGEKTC